MGGLRLFGIWLMVPVLTAVAAASHLPRRGPFTTFKHARRSSIPWHFDKMMQTADTKKGMLLRC